MDFFLNPSIGLIAIALIMAMVGVLGITVYNSDRSNATNRIFLLLSLVTICYTIANYLGLREHADMRPVLSIYLLRLTISLATLHSYVIFHLFFIFPAKEKELPRWYKYLLVPWVLVVAVASLTPLVFVSVKQFSSLGVATEISNGPLISLFGLTVIGLVTASFAVGYRKIRTESGMVRRQMIYLLCGATITYSMLVVFNFVFPAMLNDSRFVIHAPFFLLPFIFFTGYAIYKHQLFSVKVLATTTFVTLISIVYFAKVFVSPSLFDRVIDTLVFIATVLFGVLLVKSVKQEVRAREEIKKLADQLSVAVGRLEESNEQLRIIDQRKSEFVSIVSHQLRTPITVLKGYASMILEDSFGKLSDQMRPPIEKIFHSSSRLADMVTDFLDISKIEQGTMAYNFSSIDIGAMITDLGDDFAQVATKKGLAFTVHVPAGEKFIATADDGKIRQIFSNLIDNSIKYTPKGSVDVYVEKDTNRGVISVQIKDTGVGLSPDDIQHLFGKFTRGSQGQKQNTEGSGIGLYVAKKMLEAQKGTVWVDSPGLGKGSTFFVELCAAGIE